MFKEKFWSFVVLWIALFGILYFINLQNYLLFHALAEMVSIAVAVAIFMLVWNVRNSLDNSYLIFIGIAYLFIGTFDLIHTLAYQEMGLFRQYEINVQNQLWVASRYLESLSFLIGSFFLGRRLRPFLIIGILFCVTVLLLSTIFYWQVFPLCYVTGSGSTLFLELSNLNIILILGATIVRLIHKKNEFDKVGLQFIIASIVFTILSQLFLSFSSNVHDLSFFLGHYLKLLSFYCIYKAIIELGLSQPFAILFRNLKESEQALRQERNFISSVLTFAGALVLITDTQGKIVQVNKAYEALSGSSLKQIEGKCIWDLFFIPEEAEAIKSLFDRRKTNHFPNDYESHLVAEEGNQHLIRWAHTVLTDANGSVEYNVISGIDITRRKQAEEKLLKSRDELELRVQERSADLLEANKQLALRIDELAAAEKAVRESERQLRFLSSQLLTIQENERSRIARELHDELGGSLAVLKLRTSYIEKHLQHDQTELQKECRQTLEHIDQIFDEVHRLSRDLSPSILEDIGLSSAMQWLLDNFIRIHEINVESSLANVDHLFSGNEKIMLFRILQEALTNIIKHAQARTVIVQLQKHADRVTLVIQDDGKGFDSEPCGNTEISEKGLGLVTMKERTRILGGFFDIFSEKSKGTRIELNIAIQDGEQDI